MVPDSGPSLTFLSQLMAYPAFSCCMLVVWWCIGRWDVSNMFNTCQHILDPIQTIILDPANIL